MSAPARRPRYDGSLGNDYRSAFNLLTAANAKTIKGEVGGYFTAILYLSPHTSGGGATLCPYSTQACRDMCLAGAGLSGLPKQLGAKLRRTEMFNERRMWFLAALALDIDDLADIAQSEGLHPAVRLNGTSDVMWERMGIIETHPDVQFYDYTKIPLELRRPPKNYHLTFSVEGPDSMAAAVNYLRAGHSVAIVVPEDVKDAHVGAHLGKHPMIDGDEHDLRFLDPPGSIILLKPKGHVRTGLMRPDFVRELAEAARVRA